MARTGPWHRHWYMQDCRRMRMLIRCRRLGRSVIVSVGRLKSDAESCRTRYGRGSFDVTVVVGRDRHSTAELWNETEERFTLWTAKTLKRLRIIFQVTSITMTSDVNTGMPLCISNVDKSYTYLFNKNGLMKYIVDGIYLVSLFFIQMGKEPFRFAALAPNFYICVTSDNKKNSISRPTEITGATKRGLVRRTTLGVDTSAYRHHSNRQHFVLKNSKQIFQRLSIEQ